MVQLMLKVSKYILHCNANIGLHVKIIMQTSVDIGYLNIILN